MVKGGRAMLNDAGIDDDHIRTEELGGDLAGLSRLAKRWRQCWLRRSPCVQY
jgi:hypothetical protein